jgi:hypothetical protein
MNWAITAARLAMCASMVYVLRHVTARVAPLERDLSVTLSDWRHRHNQLSLLWGLPAMVVIGLSDNAVWGRNPLQPWAELRNLQLAAGLFCWFVACGFVARKRCRGFGWGLLGLFPLPFLGVALIPLLQDRSEQPCQTQSFEQPSPLYSTPAAREPQR